MKTTHYSLVLVLLFLGACQAQLPPKVQPIETPTVSYQSPEPTPTPTQTAKPSPLATASASASTDAPTDYHLSIETALPSQISLSSWPIALRGKLLKNKLEIETLNWESLNPDKAEIRSGYLVLLESGSLELKAYAPSQPDLAQTFKLEILPLPAPTPSPIPSLPQLETVKGNLGEVVSAGKYIFVTDKGLDLVHILDSLTGKVAARFKVGSGPETLAVSPDQKWVYVGCANDESVGIIDVENLKLQPPLPVGGKVFDLVAGKNRLFVSYLDAQKPLAIFEPSTSTPIGKLPEEIPGRTMLALSHNEKMLYVGTVSDKDTVLRRIDIQDQEKPEIKADTIRVLTEEEQYQVNYKGLKLDPVLGVNLKDILLSEDDQKVFLAISSYNYPSKILVLDGSSLKEIQHIDIGVSPDSLDFSPDFKYLYSGHFHYDMHVSNSQNLTEIYRFPTTKLVSQVTATADGLSVVGLLGSNLANSPKSLTRLIEVSAIPRATVK
jgi:YVTN family beta-propeller protein